jgi:hypothetical protein
VNDELRKLNKAVLAYFKVPEGTEENHDKPRLGRQVCGPRALHE